MTTLSISNKQGRGLNIGIWTAQILLAVLYSMVGFMKLSQPIPELTAMMGWPGFMPEAVVRFVGFVELAGAIGLVLPMLTKVLPRLTIFAALGFVALQIGAIGLHISQAEYSVLPINLILLLLAGFVAYGRNKSIARTE